MATKRLEQTVFRRPKAGAFARVVILYDDATLEISGLFLEQSGLDDRYFRLQAGRPDVPLASKTQRGGRVDLDAAALKMEMVTTKRGGPPIPHIPISVRVSTRSLEAQNG